ncbi:MAG TPA: hypothetical protein VE953_09295 [Terriglobales bacterium]|nr:hypothetical protein [Candidatus Dormibacteraeota bacterium]HYW24347.1 hypothetical protein [Terriglobales bacterium]
MLVIVGGGCYGCYHARQLLKAVRAGRLRGQRLVVVDHSAACAASREFADAPEVSVVEADWLAFLREWLADGQAGSEDQVIPAPLAPHLLWEWLACELGAEQVPAPSGWRLPYEVAGRAGERYLSAAGWTCPATCVEPAHCPALHAPRDWDLADVIEERARDLGYRPAVFRCVHLAYGVGGVQARELLAAREAADGRGGDGRVLVATSSRCHAAVGALRVGGRG